MLAPSVDTRRIPVRRSRSDSFQTATRCFESAIVVEGGIPGFMKLGTQGKVSIQRPGTYLPPKEYAVNHVIQRLSDLADVLKRKIRDTLATGGEFLVVTCTDEAKPVEDLVLLIRKNVHEMLGEIQEESRISFSAVKCGAVTELLADCLVSSDYSVDLRVRENPVLGFYVESLSAGSNFTAAFKNAFTAGKYFSGGKPAIERRSHSLFSFTVDYRNNRNLLQRAVFHVLKLSPPQPEAPKTAGVKRITRDDKTLKAVHKIIDFLSDAKMWSISKRPVAGWRDSKLTRLCQAGLGAGGESLMIFSLSGKNFNETVAVLELCGKISSCRACPFNCDPRLYRRSQIPDPFNPPGDLDEVDRRYWIECEQRACQEFNKIRV